MQVSPITEFKVNKFKDIFEEYLYYDPTSPSALRWKKRSAKGSKIKPGDFAGSLDTSDGYWRLHAFGGNFKVHRVVWVMLKGEIPAGHYIDHINRDSENNTIENLRVVDKNISARNKGLFSKNKLGIGNINYYEFYNENGTLIRKYTVSVRVNKKLKSRSFSITRYGQEKAFELALKAREELFILANSQGAGFTETHGLSQCT